MDRRPNDKDSTFLVECVWCGSKIREDDQEDTSAVCLQCFYQILSNHLSTQKQSAYGDFVSDR